MLSRHLTLLPASLIAAGLTSLLVAGCSNSSNQTAESPQVQEIQETPTPTPPSAELIFQQALSAAYNASTLTQDAKSINDWEAVSQGWQSAIDQLSSIPESSEKYEQAQQKIEEYQAKLSYAGQKLNQVQELAAPKPQPEASRVPQSPAPTSPSLIGRSSLGEWFVGGNLHDKTMKEWNQGTADNKLATAGDMTIALLPDLATPDLVKPYAKDLVKCLNETGKKNPSADEDEKEVEQALDNSSVAEIASVCAILMGW